MLYQIAIGLCLLGGEPNDSSIMNTPPGAMVSREKKAAWLWQGFSESQTPPTPVVEYVPYSKSPMVPVAPPKSTTGAVAKSGLVPRRVDEPAIPPRVVTSRPAIPQPSVLNERKLDAPPVNDGLESLSLVPPSPPVNPMPAPATQPRPTIVSAVPRRATARTAHEITAKEPDIRLAAMRRIQPDSPANQAEEGGRSLNAPPTADPPRVEPSIPANSTATQPVPAPVNVPAVPAEVVPQPDPGIVSSTVIPMESSVSGETVSYGTGTTGSPLDWWELTPYYASTQALGMGRTSATERVFVNQTIGGQTSPVVLSSDYEFGYQPGVEGLLGYRLDTASAAEFRFFWVNEGADSIDIASAANNLSMPFSGVNADQAAQLSSFSSSLVSRFWSAEINYVYSFRDGTDHPLHMQLVVGPRFMGQQEKLGFSTVGIDALGQAVNGSFDANAENRLFGGHAGVRGTWQPAGSRWRIGSYGSFGLFGNDTEIRRILFSITQINPTTSVTTPFESTSGGPTTFSQLLDSGVEVAYALTDNCHLTLGYRVLFLHDVARGTDTITFERPALAVSAPADTSGDIFLHGVSGGLRYFWGGRTDPTCRSGCCQPYRVRHRCCW